MPPWHPRVAGPVIKGVESFQNLFGKPVYLENIFSEQPMGLDNFSKQNS